MSREIKFRGKRVDGGEWVFGSLYYDKDCFGNITGSWIYEFDTNHGRIFSFAVELETVGQFIGLGDVNGKEIYEGDILNLKDYHGKRLVFVDFYHGVYYYTGDGFSDEYIFNANDIEILGNIYENKNLLEAQP